MLQANFHAPGQKEILTFLTKRYQASLVLTVHTNVQFSLVILMDNMKHFQCWCNAVCCCHSHIMSQSMHISLLIYPLFPQKKKTFHSTTHIQTLKKCVLWLICEFVFQCFFWSICMRWFIFIINIFNNAEQCVLLVWLYFSFINECKCNVSVWIHFLFLFYCYFWTFKILLCVLLMLLKRDSCDRADQVLSTWVAVENMKQGPLCWGRITSLYVVVLYIIHIKFIYTWPLRPFRHK